jgi:ribonuclease Y
VTELLIGTATGVVVAVAATVLLWRTRVLPKENEVKAQLAQLRQEREETLKQIEALKKEAVLEAKEEAYRIRAEAERDNREKRAEIQRLERRLAHKEETLDRRLEGIERKERQLAAREAEIQNLRREAETLVEQQKQELQRISGLTQEEAKQMFLRSVEDLARQEASHLIREIEEEARREGERRAREILVDAMQRCAADQATETTVSVVPLPSDEMKGRIIGREGRNIRAFEIATGVDVIIDDTPEAVVLSCFDPVRREVARIALTNLIADGRIHPVRIEEMVEKAREEVERRIWEAGERAVLETGVTGLAPELVKMLGKMRYRTSYGQNVLAHSVEVAHLCGVLASELGANVTVAKRAGLLHDIGKVADHAQEAPHALLTMEILRRYGEVEEVVVAAGAHHYDVEPTTIEAVLVIIADSLSAARPGARREMLEDYVKRVQSLEQIADSFPGVEKAFAVQAGREVRLIVKPDQIDDLEAMRLARQIASKIEQEMEYPGQIKVTVIRETRAVEYAR